MDAFLVCNTDLNAICAAEVKELLGKDCEVSEGLCIVRDITENDLAVLSYRAQSAYRVGVLFAKESSIEALQENFSSVADLSSWKHCTRTCSSFAVETVKLADHIIPSPDISAEFGGVVSDFAKDQGFEFKVQLKNPDLYFLVVLGKEFACIGLDMISFDLSKRPYKLFHHPSSLNGVFAYSIARYAGVNKDSVILDPFCGNGVIPIELALFQNEMTSFLYERKFAGLRYPFSKEAFDNKENELKLVKPSTKNITAFDDQLKIMLGAKKNAKIGGVLDAIEISKVSVDWLDSKFEEGDVDIIISSPPKESKRLNNLAQVKKIYDELFYQSKFILKKKGIIALLVLKPEQVIKAASKHQFKHVETKIASSGKQEHSLVICQKQ